jgi:FixJ family two-component response regulator
MTKSHPLVSVVDDDESVRESLPDLLRALGYKAEAFTSGEEFLASDAPIRTQCLILDIAMPGMTGPELHSELVRRGQSLPTIFITAIRDEVARNRLMEKGAVDCLYKPFSEAALQQAIRTALET